MDVDLRVLGPLDAYVRGQRVALGGPKQRTVLAVLVQAVGERVSTDSLLHGLYGDDLPPRGRRTVQTYVSNLRRDLGDAVRPVDRGYVLDVDPAAVDAVRFEQAVRTAVELLPDDPEAAARLLTDALGWWRGHAYADIEPVGAIAPEVTRLAELRLDAIETRIEADLACGRHADVLPELRSLTSEHPLRERLHAQHMLALYRSDRQADALRVYGEVRATLVDQVGVEPGPSLQSLEQRILVQDPGLDLARHRVERRSVLVCDLDPVHWDRPGTAALLRHRDDLITARDVDGQATIAVHGTATVVTFPDVADALGLATVLARDGGGLRIALDHGDVERGAGDEVTGPPVTRAARILALAHPGQVLLTDAAHGALATSHRTGWTVRSLGAHEVAGLADRLAIYELADEGLPGPFPPLRTDRLPPPIAVDGTGSLPGYELRERLGGNVLGDVHRAYQPAVGREVAIRVLNPAVVAGPDFVRRFEVEAQRMARLHHPHLVGLLDYWRDPTGAFLVHPLVSGRPLTIVAADGTMTPRRVLALLERLAAALEHAHRHGLVHGRLRADNVVIDDDGSPWLCDLGLAQLCAGAPGAFVHDLAAPEVFDGAPATPRTDVHDLGVLAHHLLAGTAPPPDGRLPSVGSAPDDVLARATAPDPRGRQPSVTDMVAELHLALGKQPSHRSSVATRNPYRGLATFQEVDAPDFHGRGALVGELVDALRSHRLVVVVGPSGVGKSSVVRAGLIPTLRSGAVEGSQDWVIADCSPGDHPVDRLATALRGVAVRPFDGIEDALTSPGASLEWIAAAILPPDTTLLLLVDQFEELFTGTTGEAERRAVLDLLTRIANGDGTVHVVLTLRADVFDRPLQYARFGEVMRAGLVAVRAPVASELAEIVRAPAAGVGVEVDDALVARLVADADGQPGALPLVEHLMRELFAARSGDVLSPDDYDRAGGLHGAIGRRAEQVLGRLDPAHQDVARRVCLELVAVDPDGAVVRRRVARPDLATAIGPADAVDQVVEAFTAARLLTHDRDPTTRTPTVELAHEALAQEWERLATWIEEVRAGLVARHRLEAAAAEWTAAGHDASGLLRDGRLAAAEELLADGTTPVPDSVAAFVTASRERADEQSAADRRRRRRVTVVVAGTLALALVLAGVATVQRGVADRAAATTRVRELAAASELARPDDPELALLLALEATTLGRERDLASLPSAIGALQAAVQASEVVLRLPETGTDIAHSQEGLLAVGDSTDLGIENPVVTLLDPDTGTVTGRIDTGRPINDFAFADADTLLVLHATDGSPQPVVSVVDVPGRRVVDHLRGAVRAWQMSVTDDGRFVAASSDRGDPGLVWDVATGEVVHVGPPGAELVLLGDDPLSVLEWTPRGGGAVVDLGTGDRSPTIVPASEVANAAARGDHVAMVLTDESRAAVYDVSTGAEVASAPVAFSSAGVAFLDDRRLAVGDNAPQAVVLDVVTGTSEVHPTGSATIDFAFDPVTETMFVSGFDRSVVGLAIGPEGPAVLGNLPVAEGLERLWPPGDGGALRAIVRTGPDTQAIDFIDVATGTTRRVVEESTTGGKGPVRPTAAAGGAVTSWLDSDRQGWLRAGADQSPRRLEPCQSVRELSDDGTVALVDHTFACGLDEPSPSTSQVVDAASGEVLIDLGDRDLLIGDVGSPDTPSEGLVLLDMDFESIELHDLRTGRTLAAFTPRVPESGILGGVLADDGRTAAFGTHIGVVGLVDVAAVVEDGTFDHDRHVRYLDVGSGRIALSLEIHQGILVSSADDGHLRLHDLDTLDPIADMDLGADVALTAYDGDVWYGHEGAIRRMPLDVDELVGLAEARRTRDFTSLECETYAVTCPRAATDPPTPS